MLAYTNYKPASLPDLEAIPAHWEERRMKTAYYESDVCSTTGEEEMLSVSHITGVTPRSQKNVNMFLAETNVGQKKCQPGDIVINTMWAWMAALGVSENDGIVSPSYGVYRPKGNSYNSTYLDYLLRTEVYRAEYIRNSTGINLSRLRLYPDRFLSMRFVCPPRPEQDQIVRFLDWKVSQIKRLINAKKKQIGLLQEQKRVVINDAVTKKGDVCKFKQFVINANTGDSITRETWDDDNSRYLYTAGQTPVMVADSTPFSQPYTQKNDILLARNGAGSIHIPIEGSLYTDHVIRFTLTNDVFLKYVYYCLVAGMGKVVAQANIVSLATLNKADWEKVNLCIPSKAEQKLITSQLDKRCNAIDALIIKINSEISLLREYHARLLSDVVTGKLDVRDMMVPEHETVEEAASEEAEDDVEQETDDAESTEGL